jgi:hypothetical protein
MFNFHLEDGKGVGMDEFGDKSTQTDPGWRSVVADSSTQTDIKMKNWVTEPFDETGSTNLSVCSLTPTQTGPLRTVSFTIEEMQTAVLTAMLKKIHLQATTDRNPNRVLSSQMLKKSRPRSLKSYTAKEWEEHYTSYPEETWAPWAAKSKKAGKFSKDSWQEFFDNFDAKSWGLWAYNFYNKKR